MSGLRCGLLPGAGDRGCPSNYANGVDRGRAHGVLEKLRGRLCESGVHVLTVKPGPRGTKITFGMDETPLLMAEPERVAERIV